MGPREVCVMCVCCVFIDVVDFRRFPSFTTPVFSVPNDEDLALQSEIDWDTVWQPNIVFANTVGNLKINSWIKRTKRITSY